MIRSLSILVFVTLVVGALSAAELRSFEGCRLVEAPWADGDSFPVRFPDGSEHTVRLYGADCLEANVNDSTDARRLRAQRRYFGISDYGDSARASIELAKSFGSKATDEVRELLENPFTVHTAFADAGGSGQYERVYAFVQTADGEDLATLLVRRGLARAYGIARSTAQGVHRDEYRERLEDAELVAARKGLGAWARTDWEALPEERLIERREESETAIATGRAPPSESLSINEASAEDLARIPGIGEVKARRIIDARPFETTDGLRRVSGIGPATMEDIREFVKP